MALENLTGSRTIDSLVRTNPVGADGKSFGDDHLRGIKNVILNTFANISGTVTPTDAELNHVTGVTSNVQAQIDAINTSINGKRYVEAGTIAAYPAGVPTGWLECDGSSLLRAGTYADLFAYLSTTYGNVDGTHFNLPDYRGYFLRHVDGGQGVDPDAASRTNRGDGTAGDNVGTKQDDEIKSHTHSSLKSAHAGSVILASAAVFGAVINTGDTTGATGGSETRSKNINVIWCVKY